MSKTLVKTPGKMPESGKRITSIKGSTLQTTNMNQIVSSIESSKTPKIPKQLAIISPKQISGAKSLLQKYAPDNITDSDITHLLELKYINGSFIINDNDKDVVIEVIGMLKLYPINYILDFLRGSANKQSIIWNQDFMNIGKVSVEREIFINRSEEIGVKGVGKCRYCPGTELVFAQKQVNSGDEPMKVYVRCVTCNQYWKQG